jgi:hypothetical protein
LPGLWRSGSGADLGALRRHCRAGAQRRDPAIPPFEQAFDRWMRGYTHA